MSHTTQQSPIHGQHAELGQSQASQARRSGTQVFLAGWLAGSLIVLASIWQLGALGVLSLRFQSLWPMSLLASAATNLLRLYLDQSPTLDLLLVWLWPASLGAAGLVIALRLRPFPVHHSTILVAERENPLL
jgi:hypothetical protein